ncbi:FkbM family methyltransferase [Panacibacter ginsenosidivorans]|uniref:FkbM family methyltransferase n=1 Tax=Panacibacter ginsenosidivorans TaxID=1813871 RepID=A0A5B8V790_9BACT|nr:FkbM family methyltransferase [Panacibacter ginsenosidivorans]QEC66773.1 FkbM family methyltransferase [Panacibacter ginsenosidivorans]
MFARLIYNYGIFQGLWLMIKIKLSNGKLNLPNIKYPVYFRKNSSDFTVLYTILLAKSYEFKIKQPPAVIIDAGANAGYASIYFANRFPGAAIYAVEPDAGNFEMLKKNAAPYPQITCLQKAIWNKHAALIIKDAGNGEWAFAVEEITEKNKGEIEAITLTDLLSNYDLPTIDILKIDIEGSEKEVFAEGYEPWLSKTKYLVIEVHDGLKKGCSKSVFKATSTFNFSFKRSGENLVFVNDDL